MAKRGRATNTIAKRRRTDNTMAKRRRTDNTIAKRRRTDNTMAKRTNNDIQNIIQKAKDRETRTLLKTGGELRWLLKVSSSCSTCDTCCVTLITNPVISHKWGNYQIVITGTINGTYLWSFVTRIFRSGQPIPGGDRQTFEVQHKH